jgi:putative ABC transport system permease protein
MAIPILRGRAFSETDATDAPKVVIINESMANRYWPGENPVGRRINPQWGPNQGWREIVGLAGDVRHWGPEEPATPEIYLPYGQHPHLLGMHLVLRGEADSAQLAAALRREVFAVDSTQPVFQIRPMEDVFRQTTSQRRLTTALMGMLAGLALALAAAGVYGTVTQSVALRTRELGVRVALGAQRRDIFASPARWRRAVS